MYYIQQVQLLKMASICIVKGGGALLPMHPSGSAPGYIQVTVLLEYIDRTMIVRETILTLPQHIPLI